MFVSEMINNWLNKSKNDLCVFTGAYEEGVEGFFKGIGKGLLGLLTKPAGGAVDMFSMAFDGIRRCVDQYTITFDEIWCLVITGWSRWMSTCVDGKLIDFMYD